MHEQQRRTQQTTWKENERERECPRECKRVIVMNVHVDVVEWRQLDFANVFCGLVGLSSVLMLEQSVFWQISKAQLVSLHRLRDHCLARLLNRRRSTRQWWFSFCYGCDVVLSASRPKECHLQHRVLWVIHHQSAKQRQLDSPWEERV